jgi:hypothetical protein
MPSIEITIISSLLHFSNRFNRKALATTDTELKAMAKLAIIGLSNGPPKA